MKIISLICFIIILLLMYSLIDMQRIVVRHYKIDGKDSLKILQFSDLHNRTFGRGNQRLIRIIKVTKPDILVFTGDLISRDQKDTSQLEILIKNACTLVPVYFILGNHEMDIPLVKLKPFLDRLSSYGAILLDNQIAQISKNTYLCGLTLPIKCYHDGNHGYNNIYNYLSSDLPSTCKALAKHNSDNFNILLVHNPLFFKSYTEWNVNLILAGHVHGGVIRVPLSNVGLLSPERKIIPKYCGGEYKSGEKTMIVSRGLGKFRMFNPPEVSIIEIKSS